MNTTTQTESSFTGMALILILYSLTAACTGQESRLFLPATNSSNTGDSAVPTSSASPAGVSTGATADGTVLKGSFSSPDLAVKASLDSIAWLTNTPGDPDLIGISLGDAVIDSTAGLTAFTVSGVPAKFDMADFRLSDIYIGDGRRLVLPHLLIQRTGGAWKNITVVVDYDLAAADPASAAEAAFAAAFIGSVRVMEDGIEVGRADAEATSIANASFPARTTQQYYCYGPDDSHIDCTGTGQDGENYQRLQDVLMVDNHFEYFDPNTGLTWLLPDHPAAEGHGFPYTEALEYCAAHNAALPDLMELRTVFEFEHDQPVESLWLLHGYERQWTSVAHAATGNSEYYVVNTTGALIETFDSERQAGFACVSGRSLNPEPLFPGNVDTFSGLMWRFDMPEADWTNALSACLDLESQGFDGWRMPNLAEMTLLSKRFAQGELSAPEKALWTSTTFAWNTLNAWTFDGTVWDGNDKTEVRPFYCVRVFAQ